MPFSSHRPALGGERRSFPGPTGHEYPLGRGRTLPADLAATEFYRAAGGPLRLVSAESEQDTGREPWEELYDSIDLSPGEIQMRKCVKAACRTAQTVKDVAYLLEGTYFDAYFFSEDRQRAWGYFNPEDCSFHELVGSEEDG